MNKDADDKGLRQLEERIALDLATRALSPRARRLVYAGMISAILSAGVTGYGVANLQHAHAQITRLEQQNARILRDIDNRERSDQRLDKALDRRSNPRAVRLRGLHASAA